MRESGLKARMLEMEEESKYGKMVLATRVTGVRVVLAVVVV